MLKQRKYITDTACFVLYDPARLDEKLNEECDWWTGDGDLDTEAKKENLAFSEPGSDGPYMVTVTDEEVTDAIVERSSRIVCASGKLYYGPGECLPGDEVTFTDELDHVELTPGTYQVEVLRKPAPELVGEIFFRLQPA